MTSFHREAYDWLKYAAEAFFAGVFFQQHSIGERGILISKYTVKCRFSYLEFKLYVLPSENFPAMPVYGKRLKHLELQNRKVNDLETL